MSGFLKKLSNLFISREKIFEKAVLEELTNKKFLKLRKIPAKINNRQRYKVVNNLILSKSIEGLLISDQLYFFSINKDRLTETRNILKNIGKIDIVPFKEMWKVKSSILQSFFNHLEQGYLTDKNYITKKHLTSHITSILNNQEEYNLNSLSKTTSVQFDTILSIVIELIRDGILDGIIKNQTFFLSSEFFNELLLDYLEELDSDIVELEFDFIANELEVSVIGIERYLIKIVEKDPQSYVLYPLEKKIRFKR